MLNNELIKLQFPINPAYVSSARLTVSSIANRLSFDIDETEDLKSAVSEACAYIIKRLSKRQSAVSEDAVFVICFSLSRNEMKIDIEATDSAGIENENPDEMSLKMIKALVDAFEIMEPETGKVTISMLKKRKKNFFV